MTAAVRFSVFSTGSMTSPLGGFLEGEMGDLTYPVPMFVIEHPRGTVVVDTWLHRDLTADPTRLGALQGTFRVDLAADGSDTAGPLLERAGIDPTDVGHVVLTHLHFDHAGGLADFPNARLVVQAEEWAARGDETLVAAGAYNPDDFELGLDRLELDGDHDLFDDGTVTCLLTDGHTAGHQSVRVRTADGVFVICGDCCYLRRTLLDDHLPPLAVDRERQRLAIRRMAAEQAHGATLVFGHDPFQWADITSRGLRPGI